MKACKCHFLTPVLRCVQIQLLKITFIWEKPVDNVPCITTETRAESNKSSQLFYSFVLSPTCIYSCKKPFCIQIAVEQYHCLFFYLTWKWFYMFYDNGGLWWLKSIIIGSNFWIISISRELWCSFFRLCLCPVLMIHNDYSWLESNFGEVIPAM